MREFRAYLVTTLVLDALLTIAGVVYADRLDIPAAIAGPIIAAFLLQAALYLLPGFPRARRAVESRFKPAALAALLVAGALVPYLVYAVPLGLFDPLNFAKLALIASFAPAVFTLIPPKRDALSWQDAAVMAVLVSPLISGFTTLLKEIFPSPADVVPELSILGKLMVIAVGSASFLSLRKVKGADYRFALNGDDLRTGALYFLYYLPVGIPFSMAIGLVEWAPRNALDWKLVGEFLGVALGIYLAVGFTRGALLPGRTPKPDRKEGRRPSNRDRPRVDRVRRGASVFPLLPQLAPRLGGRRAGRLLRDGLPRARFGDGRGRHPHAYGVDLAVPVSLIATVIRAHISQ